jgi:raffinose/stachyose/melibiose transport system substrate-binding protein
MSEHSTITRSTAVLVGILAAAALTGCAGGPSTGGATTITYLTQNDTENIANAEGLIAAFEKAYPDITVELNTQPAGSEGDNLVKTKLSTGTMDDVFHYNSGSLLQALNPDNQLVNLADEEWQSLVTDDFKSVVSTDNGIYGAPYGTSFGGGVLYNKKVYDQLGLTVPTSWDEFMANNETIKSTAPDVTPVLQSYGTDWTSQLFVLGDFANVAQADPDWADRYTNNDAKYVDEPALAGFAHQQAAFEAGFFNQDFASLTYEQALALLAEGKGAHYPMLSVAVSTIAQSTPDLADDIGFFALPADDAENTAATIWQPSALYIPKSTTGAELEAAKTFVAFATASDEGCAVLNENSTPTGPYVTSACTLPDDVLAVIDDLLVYFDEDRTAPALEFLSPIKGPNLPAITVQVGSGITTAEAGAELYDQDVVKQAQQLGLEGW